MKKITTSLLFLFISLAAFAQTKVGTVDSDYLLASMPELKEVQTSIEAYGGELDGQFKEMATNYQTKVTEFQSLSDTISDADKKESKMSLWVLSKIFRNFAKTLSSLYRYAATNSCVRSTQN